MPVKRNIANKDGTYFITFTCSNWLPLFEQANAYDSVYNWFNYLQHQGHSIVGYVIMPNHVHVIINFITTEKSINTIISNGKRFIAYDIVKKLQDQQQIIVLQQLSNARTETEIKNNKKHKVFETSFDWKCCDSEKFMEQKLNYLHSNPCKGKWHLAKTPIDYWHSSAKFYLTGLQGVFIVKHYKSLADE